MELIINLFLQRHGPGPGEYENQSICPKFIVSSSFKSKTPRFASSHTVSNVQNHK